MVVVDDGGPPQEWDNIDVDEDQDCEWMTKLEDQNTSSIAATLTRYVGS